MRNTYSYYINNNLSVGLWISAGIYSLLLFSEISFKLFDIGGKYVFEAALLAAFFYYLMVKDDIGRSFEVAIRRKSSELLLISFVMALILFVGLVRTANFFDVYTDFRSNFVFVLGFIAARYLLANRSDKILVLAVATSFISIVYWIYLYKNGQLGNKYTVPLFSAVVALLLSIDSRKWYLVFYSIFSLLFLSAVSFFRQYWLIALLTIFASFLKVIKFNFKAIRNIALLLMPVVVAVYFGQEFVWRLFNSSESLYIQSIGKTQDALDLFQGGSGSASDKLRLAYFSYMIENSAGLILPHGLGYKSNSENFDPWFYKYGDASSTIDSFFLFVIYHYGYLVFLPLVYWFARAVGKVAKSDGIFISGLLFFVFLIPGAFDGGQVTVIPRAFWFGVFCAYLVTSRKAQND